MVELTTPYTDDGTWLRGNLHTHTTESDGVRAPTAVVEDYAARGYDFLALSDHDTFTDPTAHRDETGLILVPAVEISANGPHVLHAGASDAVDPRDDRQSVLDAIVDETEVAIAAHPNWQESFAHWSQAELERLTGYDAIEIYNGLIESHPGAALATDRWDQLLASGRRVWGVANDDSHRPWEVARAWTVVQVKKRTPAAILESLAAGRCYASTGVTVEEISVDGPEIEVRAPTAERIRLISDHGVIQQSVAGPSATFRIPDHLVHRTDHTYVRLECVGQAGDMAWLQPMFLD